jgi:hypothetical protein
VTSTDDIYVSLEKTGSIAMSYRVSRSNNWLDNEDTNLNMAFKDQCIYVENRTRVLTGNCTAPRSFICETIVQRHFNESDIKERYFSAIALKMSQYKK